MKKGKAMREAPRFLSPRCGAHARTTGKPCKGPAMKNGRCRMHGGKSGRKPTHGFYTRAAIEERRAGRAEYRALLALLVAAGK
ncbi:MAG: HGGxSTG domain-containing protein [Rubrivivax sp.]